MKNPKVSIVIPTFNEEKEIEAALNSITSQKNPPSYEIIISDAGSRDKTLEIAGKYADQIVHEPKRTVSAGRQTGAKAASGEIMVTANADTYYPPTWLTSLIRPFEDKGIVGSLGRIYPRDGDALDNLFARAVLHPGAKALAALNLHYAASENMAVRLHEFHKAGGFNPDRISAEDTDMIQRIKSFGKVVYTPEATSYVSMRRVRKWGKLYYTYFHTTNFIKSHFFNSYNCRYEPIRE